jgi:hypothetical protein
MLRAALAEAAHAAAHNKDTYLAAQYRRLGGRRNDKRAAVAVAHSILVIAYHILDRGQPHEPYADLGGDWLLKRESAASPPARTPGGWSASWSAWATRSPWSPPTPPEPGTPSSRKGDAFSTGFSTQAHTSASLRPRRGHFLNGRKQGQ